MKINRSDIAFKIADLLSQQKPQPDLIECLKILQILEDIFIMHLNENIINSERDK